MSAASAAARSPNDKNTSRGLPKTKSWVFVELTEEEPEQFISPENVLNGHVMELYPNANARCKAFGKHTHEEFWTKEMPLREILENM